MSTNEQRGLWISSVNLHHGVIKVPWPCSKNRGRHRTIAIENPDCIWACEQLLHRARDLGAIEAKHCLFPFLTKVWENKHRLYDVTRPMSGSGLKKPWQEVRDATGLKWFRMYDTRHTGITRAAEAGIPIEITKARAGHMNDETSAWYTHVSSDAQRRWLRPTPTHAPQVVYVSRIPDRFPPGRIPPSYAHAQYLNSGRRVSA